MTELGHFTNEGLESVIKEAQNELSRRAHNQQAAHEVGVLHGRVEAAGGTQAEKISPRSQQTGDFRWAMVQLAHGMPVRRREWANDHHLRLVNTQPPLYEAILVRKTWEGFIGWAPTLADLTHEDWIVATV